MHDVVLPFERHPLHDQYDIVKQALGIHPGFRQHSVTSTIPENSTICLKSVDLRIAVSFFVINLLMLTIFWRDSKLKGQYSKAGKEVDFFVSHSSVV